MNQDQIDEFALRSLRNDSPRAIFGLAVVAAILVLAAFGLWSLST